MITAPAAARAVRKAADAQDITIRTLAKEIADLADALDLRLLWSDERSLRAEAARELLRRLGLA